MERPLEGGTHGLQRGALRAGPFIVSRTEHRPGFVAPKHTHDRASINIVLQGLYQETFRGEAGEFPPDTFLSKPAGEEHANAFGSTGAQCLLIEIEDRRTLAFFPDLFARPVVCSADRGAAEYRGILSELDPLDALTPLSIESRVLQLLVRQSRQLRRAYRSQPGWINQAVEIIHGEPHRLSLTDIARTVGVHPVHLARTFRRTHGMSIGAYARQLRIDRAVQLLRGSTLGLSGVAAEAGFYDQSHMTRLVKRATGLTPAEVRASRRSC